MATDQAPTPSSSPLIGTSAASNLRGTLSELEKRWLRERTPEEAAADHARERAVEERETAQEIARNRGYFDEFIGDRAAYSGCDLDAWQFSETAAIRKRQETIVAGVRDYIAGLESITKRGNGCVFYGPPGTGKDFLATCIVRKACIIHGIRSRFMNGIDFYARLRATMDDERQSESGVVHDLTRCGLLVFSDPLPPSGDLTPYQASMLYHVFNERAVRYLPTLVTLNVADGAEAIRRMGGATWDRIRNGAWAFACNWPSFRKPARTFGETT